MSKFKYITNGHFAVIFSEAETHADMARRVFGDVRNATSAGFGHLSGYLDGHGVDVSVYGESTSLNIKSAARDEFLVRIALGISDFS